MEQLAVISPPGITCNEDRWTWEEGKGGIWREETRRKIRGDNKGRREENERVERNKEGKGKM